MVPVVWSACAGCVNAFRLLLPETIGWPLLRVGTMLASVVCFFRSPVLMSMVHATIRGHVGRHGQCCHQRLLIFLVHRTSGCLWNGLLPEAMLMFVVSIATRCQWSELLLEVMFVYSLPHHRTV